jgi:hypothetical protein
MCRQLTERNKQKYRLRAEREYAATKKVLHKPPTSAEEASMQELRRGLDNMLEYQASDAPPISFRFAHHPAREGILMDYLYEREMRKDIAEAERLQKDDAAEKLAKGLKEMELDDNKIPLEDEERLQTAKAEVVEEDVSIPQTLREIRLEGQKASFGEAAQQQQEQQEQKAFI